MTPPGDLRIEALGVGCAVRCRDPELAAVIGELWSPFAVEDARPAAGFEVAPTGSGWTVTGPAGSTPAEDRSAALTGLATALNAHVLGTTRFLACHAAVVTVGRGAVAFLAESGTGKSTLTAALLRRGCGYVSDESLCLDPSTGDVVAYPRPVALLPWSRAALGLTPRWPGEQETLYRPADLGGVVVRIPPPLTQVVLLERSGDPRARLEPLSRQRAAAGLLRHSFNHWRDPATAFRIAHEALSTAAAWRMTLGDPGASAELVLSTFAAEAGRRD